MSEADGALYVRVDKRKISCLLRVFGELKTNSEMFDLFKGILRSAVYSGIAR